MTNFIKKIVYGLSISCVMTFSLQALATPKNNSLEQAMRQAITGSKMTLESRADAIVITVPVEGGFHPKREGVLLPASLRPITNVAKFVKQNNALAVLIIGHTDNTGSAYVQQDVSEKRAGSVGSIFRIAGITKQQMFLSGVGSTQPKTTNNTKKGKSQNQRVEIIVLVKPANQGLASLPNQYAVNYSTSK